MVLCKRMKRHLGNRFTWTIPVEKATTSSSTREIEPRPTQFAMCRAYCRDLNGKKEDDEDLEYTDYLSACWVEHVIDPTTQTLFVKELLSLGGDGPYSQAARYAAELATRSGWEPHS